MKDIVWPKIKTFLENTQTNEILCYLERKYDTPEKKSAFARQLDTFLMQFKKPGPLQPVTKHHIAPSDHSIVIPAPVRQCLNSKVTQA